MEARHSVFRQLKPPCVALNQALLALQADRASPALVAKQLRDLKLLLSNLGADKLDPKLAEYVFVPVSFALKALQRLPLEAHEIIFGVIAILLRHGWRDKVAGPLGSQLLILFSMSAEQYKSRQQGLELSDDLKIALFACFESLFQGLALTPQGREQLLDTATIPHLGHGITIILEGLASALHRSTQLAAAKALSSLVASIHERETLASFLPGMMSSLTKVISPSTQIRRSWDVLVCCLDTYRELLVKTVADRSMVPVTNAPVESTKAATSKSTKLDGSWLRATSGQLKLSIANVNRLLDHERPEVRQALAALNATVLQECTTSLLECRQMCLEALVHIDYLGHGDEAPQDGKRIPALLQQVPDLVVTLQSTIRDWSMSLHRILDGSDEEKKVRQLDKLFTAYNAVLGHGGEMSILQSQLTQQLPDYVAIILGSKSTSIGTIVEKPAVRLENLPIILRERGSTRFPNALVHTRHQSSLLERIQSELQHLDDTGRLRSLAESFAVQVREASGSSQLANFYLALSSLRTTSVVDDFVDLQMTSPWRDDILADLYDLSLSILLSPSDHDESLTLLALESVAIYASHEGVDYRPELLSTLYPVLGFLASPSPHLRNHAVTTLNILANACHYDSVKDLVVSNADYLVNSIALKLNAFEVDPEAPQILSMAVKLAGPGIVPFLGDTVDSIFAILEDYHGYERLVELLFGSLRSIAEQGASERLLSIPSGKAWGTTENECKILEMADLASLLAEKRQRRAENQSCDDGVHESAPHRPWSSSMSKPESTDQDGDDPNAPARELENTGSDIPAPNVYPLLLRIASLTAHYLPSSSSSLRVSLLGLLHDILPALSKHEDSFLPLINTLWPQVIARLRDPESAVVQSALAVMDVMAQQAGTFMRSRFRDIWSSILVGLQTRVARDLGKKEEERAGPKPFAARTVRTRGSSETAAWAFMVREKEKGIEERLNQVGYVDPSVRGLWAAVRSLILTVVRDVGVDEVMFEDALDMLRPTARLEAEQLAVLERVSPGAVWVARWREDPGSLVVPDTIKSTAERWKWAGVTT